MSGISGVEVTAALKKGRIWNVPEVVGANDGILILPTGVKRDAPVDVDDSLGQYFSRDGLPGPIKVEGDIPAYLRYDGLDVFLALFMGIAGSPTQQGATAAYAYTYKWKANIDGLFGTFVKNRKYYIEESVSAKAATLSIKGEAGKALQAGVGVIISNKIMNPILSSPVTATVNVGTGPVRLAYCPLTNHIYVANSGSDNVSVIDPVTYSIVATINVGTGPYSVTYCPSTNHIYVANYSLNTVSVIDPVTYSIVATINVGAGPQGVAYCPSTNHIYVVNYNSANVSVIDPVTYSIVTTINVGTNPQGVAHCPSTNHIYVVNYGSANASVIDPVTYGIVTTINVGTGPCGLVYCPSTNHIYVVNSSVASVSIINPVTYGIVATLNVGSGTYGITYCPSTNHIYVTNSGAASVSIINPITYGIVATRNVGSGPYGITYCPSTNRISCACYASNTVIFLIPESNTTATFNNVTWIEMYNRIKFSDGVFRINNQSVGALGSGDTIYPASFELTAKRKLKGEYTGEYKTYYPNAQDIIDEPCNDGMPEITLKLTFPRHNSSANIAALVADTRKKMDITFTGALIEGSYYRQFKLQFPHLQFKDVPVADAQGNIKEPLEFVVHGCDTAPTGMTGLTDPFWISGINRRTTDPLA